MKVSNTESPRTANAEPVERSWEFAPGAEVVPGVRAWARLGHGRHCETWLAWCLRRWTPVSVKLPRPDLVDGPARQALAREAALVGPLAHPGVQRLLEARLDAPLPYLVFEYAEGPTLDGLLDDADALTAGDTLRLGLQLGSVLHYLHGRGLVHLDVKPANVVVRDGRVVLLDFDLARTIGEGGGERSARGSPPYMAPEQVRCRPAAPSMDLFALGATLYEAATGVAPFAAEAHASGAADDTDSAGTDSVYENEGTGDGQGDGDGAGHETGVGAGSSGELGTGSGDDEFPQLTRPAPPLRSLRPDLPDPLVHAIHALLEPDPGERPASAAAALMLLASALPEGQPALWPDWAADHAPAPGGDGSGAPGGRRG